jgi:ubiquinone/menaquinone biosynthesis C-methylase UbiE
MSDREAVSKAPDFGARAARYDELRPVDENWWQLFDLVVGEADLRGRRVLDVGCGTGRFAAALAERAGAKVWAIDPSLEMLEVARRNAPPGVGFKTGSAESLPFKDAWFERVTMRLVVHLLDRPRALAEARRVLGAGGRLAIASFDPAHFDEFWLNRLFPSLERIDRARFPTPATLEAELRAAGFGAVRIVPLSQARSLDRRDALEKIRGRHISTFDLLDEEEYRAGLGQAERELPARVAYRLEWAVFVAVL